MRDAGTPRRTQHRHRCRPHGEGPPMPGHPPANQRGTVVAAGCFQAGVLQEVLCCTTSAALTR